MSVITLFFIDTQLQIDKYGYEEFEDNYGFQFLFYCLTYFILIKTTTKKMHKTPNSNCQYFN
jgi:hypothetical protein